MIGRRFRVPVKDFFKQKQQKRLLYRSFTVSFVTNRLPYHRLGAIIPNTTVQKAVDRHSIKRIVLDKVPKNTCDGLDIVFFANKNTKNTPKKELKRERDQVFKEIFKT